MGKKSDKNLPAKAAGVPARPDYITEGQQGLEDVEQKDLLFPRAVLMQDLSPQVKEKKFSAGDIVNSVTGDIIVGCEDQPIEFIPVLFWHEWIEWQPRDEGGGMIEYSRDREGELARRYYAGEMRTLKDGREVRAVTAYLVFLVQPLGPDGTADASKMFCIGCAKSNLKHGRKLLTLAKMRGNVPLFAGKYTFGPNEETNRKLNTQYWAFEFENAGWTPSDVFEVLTKLHEELKKSTVGTTPEEPEPDADTANSEV